MDDDDAAKWAAERDTEFDPIRQFDNNTTKIYNAAGATKKQWRGMTYIIVFTDGSANAVTSPWLAYAGWGVYIGPGYPANSMGPYVGQPVSSFAAEVTALADAVVRAVEPVWIVTDCL